MKVEVQKELAERKPLADIAAAATSVLEQAIGVPAKRVTAIWDFRADDRGNPKILLTLLDRAEHSSREFAPEELQPPEKARLNFHWLWGDLLQQSSQRLMKTLEAYSVEEAGT